MPSTALVSAVYEHARRSPKQPALVVDGQLTDYAALGALIEDTRRWLHSGDTDGPLLAPVRSSPAAIAFVLACVAERRVALLPSPELPEATLVSLADRAGCRHRVAFEPGQLRTLTPTKRLPPVGMPPGCSLLLTTSGSTGLPKIVPIDSAGFDRFVRWARHTLGLRRGIEVLSLAPLNFDLSLLEVWTTLAVGGCVNFVDHAKATQGEHLLELLAQRQVELVEAVPMFHRLLADAAQEHQVVLPAVRAVLLTGDVTPPQLLPRLRRLFPNARILNVYGCTETNDSLVHEVPPDATDDPLPLGQPVDGTVALVMDGDAPVRGPGRGELVVCTPFQGPGYLDAELTRQRFVRLPSQPDRVFFRTGDMVRRDDNGALLLEGRMDSVVKVRGTRVNTQEVEAVLRAHPAVVEAAVVPRADEMAGTTLTAVVRRASSSDLNSLQVRQHCAAALARTAIPSRIAITDDPLPRNSNGKLDRARLIGA